ncbi:methyl-accepting chemotaxis protein [Niallia sp. Krafla_26]|uniref:methyl-accepting chemotaxis protein n=1 Tax=Niallia sp. Krafla_26 TaxID=3064703 RepID=UPI003D174951
MRLTVGKKIFGGFFFILLLLAIGSLISSNRINFTDESYSKLIYENVENAMYAKDLNILYLDQSNAVKSYLLTGDETYIEHYEEQLNKANETMKEMLKVYQSERDLEIIEQLVAFQLRFDEIVRKEIALKNDGDTVGYTNLMNTSGKTISNVFQKKIEDLDKGQETLVFSGIEETSKSVDQTKTFVLVIGIISMLMGTILAILITRSITKPIKSASEALGKIAAGNLQIQALEIKSNDEVGDLGKSYYKMIEDLRSVLGQIQESASSVASSSEELAASSQESTSASEQVSRMTQDSAEGIEKQLLYFKELSQSINEMNEGISQIAENSENMLHLTEKTSSLTNEGEGFIEHVVKQMNQIQKTVIKASDSIGSLQTSSNEISQIIEIITGVAEQTNLLALNAAIEAARASEHGRGFAVVADEVRKLAEESKRSAGQITKMIQHIQVETNESVNMMNEESLQVKEGLRETEEAYKAFKSISNAMEEVSQKVIEVSAAVEEMTAVTSQIVNAIKKVEDIAEKSSHNSQESAAATEQQFAAMQEVAASAQFLSKMAEDLQSILSKFKL